MTRAALVAGVAVPLLYFGSQLATAPFHPGYDFVAQVDEQPATANAKTRRSPKAPPRPLAPIPPIFRVVMPQ